MIMAIQQQVGNYGESKACEFLIANGYEVVERNFRAGRAEVDIIAKLPDTFVFIEVKTRKSIAYGYPEEFVDERKIELIHAAAETYCDANNWRGHIRFDIIAIVKNNQGVELEHFEDAF